MQDLLSEGTEQFSIILANPINAQFETFSAMATIDDDELSACGEPALNPGTDTGLFIWQDCQNPGHWTLRVIADTSASATTFLGSLSSDQYFFKGPGELFANIIETDIESNDLIDLSNPLIMEFVLAVANSGVDEFSFEMNQDTDVCLELDHPASSIYIGEKKVPMPSVLQLNTLGSCIKPPVLNTLDLASAALVHNYDFGVNIINNLDTANKIPQIINEADGWYSFLGAMITPDVDIAPSGETSTQVSTMTAASKWAGVGYSLAGLSPGHVYELEIEVKPGDDNLALTIYEGENDAKWVFYLRDTSTASPYIKVQAGYQALWTALEDLGSGWYKVRIRIDTDNPGTAITDWNSVALKFFHNQLETDAPTEYGKIKIYEPELSQLYKHFTTRYKHGRDFKSQGIGRAQLINNAWSRMSDNDNHRLDNDSLDLVAHLYSLTDGGIESGMIRSRAVLDPAKTYYYETRMQTSEGAGFWSNFWLLSDEPNVWPPEIDIVEIVQGSGDPNWNTYTSYHTLHGNYQSPNIFAHENTFDNQYSNTANYANTYHTFAALVTPSHVAWFVDDILVRYAEMLWYQNGSSIQAPGPNMIIDFVVGGDWPGAPDNLLDFPATLSVDYLKVWELP